MIPPQTADFDGTIPRILIGTLLHVDIFNNQWNFSKWIWISNSLFQFCAIPEIPKIPNVTDLSLVA